MVIYQPRGSPLKGLGPPRDTGWHWVFGPPGWYLGTFLLSGLSGVLPTWWRPATMSTPHSTQDGPPESDLPRMSAVPRQGLTLYWPLPHHCEYPSSLALARTRSFLPFSEKEKAIPFLLWRIISPCLHSWPTSLPPTSGFSSFSLHQACLLSYSLSLMWGMSPSLVTKQLGVSLAQSSFF